MKSKLLNVKLMKFGIRILLWLLLLICVPFVTFLVLGYFAGSRPVSYLPEPFSNDLKRSHEEVRQVKLTNSGYELLVNDRGDVKVTTKNNEQILTSFEYYSLFDKTAEKWGLDDVSVSSGSDSTVLISGNVTDDVSVKMLLTVPKDCSKLDVHVTTHYSKNTVVSREAIVAGFDVPVREVYRKNRQIDLLSFEPEYWLNKQGAMFGNGERSALVYQTPGISSLQLDTKRSRLFVNLEYYLDHPYVHFPYQEDNGGRWDGGKWLDMSQASYSEGAERNSYFSVYFGKMPENIPRIMQVPDGNLAGYVFTEHADGGNIRTQRAVYFGAEDIMNVNDAVGGFVGNKIPTTKSVHYANPEKYKYLSVRDDPDYPQFLDFLDQLEKTGMYEICLHTPEDSTSNRKMLEESIGFMKNRFDAITWIDHGMYGGKINRECFVDDALDNNSQYYTADLWEKFNTRYFWSPAIEMIRKTSWVSVGDEIKKFRFYASSVAFWTRYLSPEEIKKMNFFSSFIELMRRYSHNGELNSLMPSKGESYPTPLFFQHPTRTRLFYSWATDYSTGFRRFWTKSDKTQFSMEQKQLDQLIASQGVFIRHGYYIRNLPGYDETVEINGQIILKPYFEKTLESMAHMRDKGDLYITTIRDLMDYWILTENVCFSYLPDGDIIVNNNNDKPIKGLSLIVHNSKVSINGEIPKFRKAGDETIFWFDIKAGESVILKLN